jgi:hypothetical protein
MIDVLLSLYLLDFVLQERSDRYFKEDHLTGADYVWLAADHTYCLTGREHMGIWILESGRWERSGDGIKFVPKDEKKQSHTGAEVNHKGRTFLAFSDDSAPGIVIPIEEIKRGIDANPKSLPSYVFFEIDKSSYARETGEAYPFRTKNIVVIPDPKERRCAAAPDGQRNR